MSEEIVKVIKIESGDSERTVKGLRDEIKDLRDALLNAEKGSKEYNEITQKIVKDQQELNQVMNAGSKELKGERVELKELKLALQQLEPGTEAYNKAFTRAATITHDLAEQQELLRYSSADLGTQLGNIKGIATNMVAGFSAINAAMGLFGKESEDVQKAMLKTQQLMALVQGMQGLDGMVKRLKGVANALKTTTVAQKGLNAAIKANPIGLLLAALAALIVYWKDIWGWITKLVGGTEKMNALMDEAKAKIMGLASAIGNYLIMPVKTAFEYFKMLGNVLKDIFTGNWKNIKNDVKDGINGIKEEVVNGFSFMKNYEDAYNKQSTKNAKKRYEEQKKIMEEQTQKNKEQYDKDLDNYIKDQEAKTGSDWKWTEEGKKAYEALYKNRMELYAKDTEEYRRAQRDMWVYAREYQDRIDRNKKSGGGGKTQDELDKEAYKKRLEAYKKVQDFLNTIEWQTKKMHDNEIQMIKDLKDYYGAIIAKTEDADVIENITNTFLKEVAALRKIVSENVSKLYVDEMYDAVAAIEKAGEVAVDRLNSEFDLKKLMEGIIVPEDIIKHLNEVFEKESDTIKQSLDVVEGQLSALKEIGLEGTETYMKLLDTRTEMLSRQKNLEIQYIKDVSDAEKESYEIRLEEYERYYDNMKRETERNNARNSNEGTGFRAEREMRNENDSYDVEKQRLEAIRDLYEEMTNNINLSIDERRAAYANLYQTMMDLDDLEIQHEIKNNAIREELIKEQISTYKNFAESVGDVLGAVSDAWETNLRQKVEAGKVSQQEAEKEFERIKGLQVAQAVINTLAGSVGAFLQAASAYPPPWSFIIGGAAATTATIAGIAQIAKIKSTKFESSGNGGGSSISGFQVAQSPTADFNPNYQQNVTNQSEIDNLANAVRSGMNGANMSVSVSEIDDVQNRVRVREQESTW